MFRGSLTRTFAILSLVTISVITAVQVLVQSTLLSQDLLELERTASAEAIRLEANRTLRSADFMNWRGPEAQERFAAFFRNTLSHDPDVLRVKLYDREMHVVWSDEPRLLGARFPENAELREALSGRTTAHLQQARRIENVYERAFGSFVELYIPLSLAPRGPGPVVVDGVVEVYKDPSRMFATLNRDRLIIVATSLLGGLVLYGALFSIVHRASRQLESQREALHARARALTDANAELRSTQAQLRAAERLAAIGEVSTAVAHGIRNPLANIRAAAQVALEVGDDPDAVRRRLGAIRDEVDRLGVWLRALLDAARPFDPSLVPVDVTLLVDEAVAVVRERLVAAECSVRRTPQGDVPKVLADGVHLQQALVGILENAIDASPRGATIEIGTATTTLDGNPAIRFTIRDEGRGIPPEQLTRVFEPFFTTRPRGTGVGLSVARKVVERHGGRVDIASQPGAGTAVTILLPVAGPGGHA
jgi:signal transduction histidine kinase